MKFLVTGSHGFLGSSLVSFLEKEGETVLQTSRRGPAPGASSPFEPGDLLDAPFVDALIQNHKFDVVINTAGLVNVDECEKDPAKALQLNAETAENTAKAARKNGAFFIHVSTDHLFDGSGRNHSETHPPKPINQYGKTKLEAESRVLAAHPDALVLRTNFFGWSHPDHPPTFAEWLFESLKEGKKIRLFTDYYFSSIEVSLFCGIIRELAGLKAKGVLNVVSRDRFSKYEFGEAMAKVFGFSMDGVEKVKFADFPLPVPRPADLSLSTDKASGILGRPLPSLREGLEKMKENTPRFTRA